MKLSGLTRESVFEAIKIIDTKKLSARQVNSDFRVLIGGKYYPFKLLVENAYRISTGIPLPEGTFKEYFYLVKQFEQFTGFKVKVTAAILFRKKFGFEFHIIIHSSFLINDVGDSVMDLSVLGPSVNDWEIKKRRFRNNYGLKDIKRGDVFVLVTPDKVYGAVKVIEDRSVILPIVPVKPIFRLAEPIAHGLDFSDESYPIIEASYYGDYVKELFAAIEKNDPDFIDRSIDLFEA